MTRGEAKAFRRKIEKASSTMSDADALEAVGMFPSWQSNHEYSAGERVRWIGKLYRCEQGHVSQAGWTPDSTPALWTEVAKPGEIPVWRQPTGAQDAYNLGDRVRYPDDRSDVWVSTVKNNVWEPGVYGWKKEEQT